MHFYQAGKLFNYNLFLFFGESVLYYVPILLIAAFVSMSGGSKVEVSGFIILSLINLFFCFLLRFLMSFSTFWLTRPEFFSAVNPREDRCAVGAAN